MKVFLKPLWVFAPIFAAFGVSAWIRGVSDGFLAGMVFSGFLALRFREALLPQKLFPVFMLFLFLLGIGHTPSRDFTPTLSYTTQFLICLRMLFLILGEIQSQKTGVSTGTRVIMGAILCEAVISGALAAFTFHAIDSRAWTAFRFLHLRLFLVLSLVGLVIDRIGTREQPK
jgi:hypothetical protein